MQRFGEVAIDGRRRIYSDLSHFGNGDGCRRTTAVGFSDRLVRPPDDIEPFKHPFAGGPAGEDIRYRPGADAFRPSMTGSDLAERLVGFFARQWNNSRVLGL